MTNKKTFDLQDLDEEFWSKVVFFLYESTSYDGWIPGDLYLVTEDKKQYHFGEAEIPGSMSHLHPMFKKTLEYVGSHFHYVIEDNGWVYLEDYNYLGDALIRRDMYDSFREKAQLGHSNPIVTMGLALGTDSLEEMDYIRSVMALEKQRKNIAEIREERERKKILPEHFAWKTMYGNTELKNNDVIGEYALLVNRKDDGMLSAQSYTILYQRHMIKPLMTDWSKGTEYYVLFEKDYDELYGPIDYPSPENNWNNKEKNDLKGIYQYARFNWTSLSKEEMQEYGRFLRCFKTAEEAREYALCFANEHGGNCFTLVKELDPLEDHKRRVERYEAYQMYKKHYREIMDIIVNDDVDPDNTNWGHYCLLEAILKRVPEISTRRLLYFGVTCPGLWRKERRIRLK